MPFKHHLPYKHKFAPIKYRVTNWSDYNKALKDRGDLTIWFDDNATKKWYYNRCRKPGGKIIYSDVAIEVAATLHLIFNLPMRQTEGFMRSLVKLMNISLLVPNYSTVSRRMKRLKTKLRVKNHKSGTHIIIDGSGLSVYGSDEFYKVEKGYRRTRGYRRFNIAINEHQEITACELTDFHESETKQVPKLLRRIEDHSEIILADGNYDNRNVYSAIKKYRPTKYARSDKKTKKKDTYNIIIPPRTDAKPRQRRGIYPLERSDHIKAIKNHGKMSWQKDTGYGIRSLVEVSFSRYKRIFGPRMHAIDIDNQKSEARLACRALNIMTSLGMPLTDRIN